MAARKGRSEGQLDFGFSSSAAKEGDEKKTPKGKKTVAAKKPTSVKAVVEVVETDENESELEVTSESVKAKTKRNKKGANVATAESMATQQRDISISEFFAKNRHLLGFDNPRKALLTAVKEAVDNSLDACEEAQILPRLEVTIQQIKTSSKFVLTVTDNGPGIVKNNIPNVFARLLYGSKFHSLKMSRGQQGIGISAAGMYGQLTTGEPVDIVSRTSSKKPAHHYKVKIDTAKNKPQIILDEECESQLTTGTSVTITLEGKYQKGRQSVDEYLAQTAIANPHATMIYNAPDGEKYEYERKTDEAPFVPKAIKPHPYGVELGLLYKMAQESPHKQLSAFLQKEFSRVSLRIANQICEKAKVRGTLNPSKITLKQAEAIHQAIIDTKIIAPSTDCIAPIGEVQLEEGLKRVVEADFYASCSRTPAVYRGNPFLIEAALAYGIRDKSSKSNGNDDKEPLMRLNRIANRVPLLYQQSGCAIYKAVLDINWRNYAMSQSRGALPAGPVMLTVHMASVWVPFTSESKEAIAHYPEIIKEIQLAVQECGRKLGMYLRKKKRIQQEMAKRSYIETYLPYIGEALQEILLLDQKEVDEVLAKLEHTLEKTRKI